MKKVIELEREDLNALHDVILEVLTDSGDMVRHITDEVVLNYWNKLPEHLKAEAEHWGLSDSVVRDNIYVWLQKNI